MATRVTEKTERDICGTTIYMAPEMLKCGCDRTRWVLNLAIMRLKNLSVRAILSRPICGPVGCYSPLCWLDHRPSITDVRLSCSDQLWKQNIQCPAPIGTESQNLLKASFQDYSISTKTRDSLLQRWVVSNFLCFNHEIGTPWSVADRRRKWAIS